MGWLIRNYNGFEVIAIIATTESFLQCALGNNDPSLGGGFISKLCHLYSIYVDVLSVTSTDVMSRNISFGLKEFNK